MAATSTNSRLSFGLFEVDLDSGELWKAGFRVKLQGQPFKVLTALLERPGKVVTREELQLRLWGPDTVVDFDHSLGTAINKIREALGDSADNPRFIETLSRRGYRFIAPVSLLPENPAAVPPAPALPEPQLPTPVLQPPPEPAVGAVSASSPELLAPLTPSLAADPGRSSWRPLLGLLAIIALASLFLASGYLLGLHSRFSTPTRISRITESGHLAISPTDENLDAGVTDGVHLFAPLIENGQTALAAISLSGGTLGHVAIPAEIASPSLGDISPDGSRLLLREHLSPESEQPLWVLPTIGGSAQRIGNVLAHDATWMPDGQGILFASGNDLYLTHLSDNNPKLFATLPGRAFWLRWSPTGGLLRFTIVDPIAHTSALWQISLAHRSPVRLLPGFSNPASECCGVWNSSGSRFVFRSAVGGNMDLWQLEGTATRNPLRLTNGPLQFQSPVASRSDERIYFLGVDARSELERLTPDGLVPEKGFLASAVRVEYSRDGRWVAWTDSTGQLWRAHADGSEQLQLTASSALNVFLARWSPDGSRLVCMAREPGHAWQLYLIGSNGNNLHPLLREARNAADPSWSPDGKTLVFGRVDDAMGKESASRTLELFNLQTGRVEPVAGSENLFSPRWSPDGRYIAALSLDQRRVRLLDVSRHSWTTLPVRSGADPVWSSDSRFLFLHASLDPDQPIERVSVPAGEVRTLFKLADPARNDAVDYVFGGLTPANEPLIRTRVSTGDVYSMQLH